MKNNLFTYATSELSQDAFLCWLLSYAMKESKEDAGLRDCAVNFIKSIICELSCSNSDVHVTEIKQQYKNTDILFIVNNKYVVIIENKTYTSAREGQLSQYAAAIAADEKYRIYSEPVKVFYKTWFIFDKDLYEIKKARFNSMDIINIVEMLAPYAARTDNRIFLDYIEYWEKVYNSIMEYKTTPIKQWKPEHIFGFYRDFGHYLAQHGVDAYFKEDTRPGGDKVYVMYFNNGHFIRYNNLTFTIYLQLEFKEGNLKLSLKTNDFVDTNGDSSNKKYKALISYLIYEKDEEGTIKYAFSDFGFVKPFKLGGRGASRTIGEILIDVNSYNEVIECVNTAFTSFQSLVKSIEVRNNTVNIQE